MSRLDAAMQVVISLLFVAVFFGIMAVLTGMVNHVLSCLP